jgi:hypothetical protein
MTKARDISSLVGSDGIIDNTKITLDANEVPSLDTAKITTGTFASARINNASLSAITSLPSGVGGTAWQSVQTSGFTAIAGRGYPCNTTSSAFTVTLPASASAGDTIILLDYAGTADTNSIIINPNGNKIEGGTANLQLTGDREGVTLTYIDATQGWLAVSGIQEGTDVLSGIPYSVDFLVIAGGAGGAASYGGGGGSGGYRNSYSTETSGGGGSSEASLSFVVGTVYTITVGSGGADNDIFGTGNNGSNGTDSSISGTALSTITSSGGGGGGANTTGAVSGGSGGGGGSNGGGGAGTSNQGYRGGNASTGGSGYAGSGGGGAGAIGGDLGSAATTGGNGGAGLASSITGSSVTRGGGGGGGAYGGSIGTGGTGGGGNGGKHDNSVLKTGGTANTGSGGGGGSDGGNGNGGSGVVILRMPTANYSSTTTGSPTVSTSGSDTILVYNASGTYTG